MVERLFAAADGRDSRPCLQRFLSPHSSLITFGHHRAIDPAAFDEQFVVAFRNAEGFFADQGREEADGGPADFAGTLADSGIDFRVVNAGGGNADVFGDAAAQFFQD